MKQVIKGDKIIWLLVVLLFLTSALLVYSSTIALAYRMGKPFQFYLAKQVGVLAFALAIIFVIQRIDYAKLARFGVLLFLISIATLIYSLFWGTVSDEGTRWVKLPLIGLGFEASEFARLALIIFLARTLSLKQKVILDFKQGFLAVFIPILITCGLLAPVNLLASVILGITCSILFFVGRVRIEHLFLSIGIGFLSILLLYSVSKVFNVGQARTLERFSAWMSNENSTQAMQAKIAIANGGITGLGPGQGIQKSFLPNPYSSYIYAVIIEEYGVVGGVVVMLFYLLLLWRCINIFKRSPYAFGAFLTLAFGISIVFQAALNMAINVGLLPVAGLNLPFISMGGSSIWFQSIGLGIILNVSRFNEEFKQKQQNLSDDRQLARILPQ